MNTMTNRTVTKTLWTETLVEDLFSALKRNKSDGTVKQIVQELKAKGLPEEYLENKVRTALGQAAAERFTQVSTGRRPSKAPSADAVRRTRMQRYRKCVRQSRLKGMVRKLTWAVQSAFIKG